MMDKGEKRLNKKLEEEWEKDQNHSESWVCFGKMPRGFLLRDMNCRFLLAVLALKLKKW